MNEMMNAGSDEEWNKMMDAYNKALASCDPIRGGHEDASSAHSALISSTTPSPTRIDGAMCALLGIVRDPPTVLGYRAALRLAGPVLTIVVAMQRATQLASLHAAGRVT